MCHYIYTYGIVLSVCYMNHCTTSQGTVTQNSNICGHSDVKAGNIPDFMENILGNQKLCCYVT